MRKRDIPALEKKEETPISVSENDPETITKKEAVLIDETIDEIKEIYQQNSKQTYLAIGQLIISKIYSDDLGAVDFSKGPKKKDVNKWIIFKILTEEVEKRSERGEGLPKKTFLYNSVRLVQDHKLLAGCPEYDKLQISQKICLLSVSDINEKAKFAKMVLQEELSVKKLRETISDKQDQKEKSLSDFIKCPDEINDIMEFLETKLETLVPSNKVRESAITRCNKRKDEILKEIGSMNLQVEKLDALTNRLKSLNPRAKDSKK